MAITFAAPTESTARIPAGRYVTTLKEITEAEASTFNPDVQRLKFIFTIKTVESIDEYPVDVADDDAAMDEYDQSLIGSDHWEWTNNKMGPNSTLRAWLSGMLGRTIQNSDRVSPDQFVGKDYEVTLGMKPYRIQQTGESGEKFTILTIKPYREPRRRTRQQAAPDPEGFDDDEPELGPDGKPLPF